MKMKKCPHCKKEKCVSNFYKRRDRNGYTPYCKICTNTQSRNGNRKLKIKCVEYKGEKCVRCGFDEFISALEFHHIDPSKKDYNISRKQGSILTEKIKKELDRCMLLCSNCHRGTHNELAERERIWNPTIQKEIFENAAKKRSKSKCIDCKAQIELRATRCVKCYHKNTRKIEWPPIKDIEELMKNNSMEKVGRLLGVSSNAVRKHIANNK